MSRKREQLWSSIAWSRSRPEEEFFTSPTSSAGTSPNNSPPRVRERDVHSARAACNYDPGRLRVNSARPYSGVFSTTATPGAAAVVRHHVKPGQDISGKIHVYDLSSAPHVIGRPSISGQGRRTTQPHMSRPCTAPPTRGYSSSGGVIYSQHEKKMNAAQTHSTTMEGLKQDLHSIAAQTGRTFDALAPLALPDSPKFSGSHDWHPSKQLLGKAPEALSPQEARMTWQQVREADWDRKLHTNKMSRLMRLGADIPPPGMSPKRQQQQQQQQMELEAAAAAEAADAEAANADHSADAAAEGADGDNAEVAVGQRGRHIMRTTPSLSVYDEEGEDAFEEAHGADVVRSPGATASALPLGTARAHLNSEQRYNSQVNNLGRSAVAAIVSAHGQRDFARMQRQHFEEGVARLRAAPGFRRPNAPVGRRETEAQAINNGETPPSPSLDPLAVLGRKDPRRIQAEAHLKRALDAVAQRDRDAAEAAMLAQQQAAAAAAALAAAAQGSFDDSGSGSDGGDDGDGSEEGRRRRAEEKAAKAAAARTAAITQAMIAQGGLMAPGAMADPGEVALAAAQVAASTNPDSKPVSPHTLRIEAAARASGGKLHGGGSLHSLASAHFAEHLPHPHMLSPRSPRGGGGGEGHGVGAQSKKRIARGVSRRNLSIRPAAHAGEGALQMEEEDYGGQPMALAKGLFIPDPLITPEPVGEGDDDEDGDDGGYSAELRALKEADGGKDRDGQRTYSRLLKPALNSAQNPFHLEGQGQAGWDPSATLMWGSRGIGPRKMSALKDTLTSNTFLTGLQLGGNNLDNGCIADVLSILSLPEAPRITQLDLSMNTSVTWRCCLALALALGARPSSALMSGGGDGEEGGHDALPANLPITSLPLRRLMLTSLKLGDKGASELASALANNTTVRELDVSRCGITDLGGRALMESLACNICLASINVSWNALRGDSARALQSALEVNPSLQRLDLSHNGFSDTDAARIIKGLVRHGRWRHMDLSYNNLGAGTAVVIGELSDALAQAAAAGIAQNTYAQGWDESIPAGLVDTDGWYDPPGSPTSPSRFSAGGADIVGQLADGPLLIDLSGNPLGFAGTRQILHSLDWVSLIMEHAVVSANQQHEVRQQELIAAAVAAREAAMQKRSKVIADPTEGAEQIPRVPEPAPLPYPTLPPWPLYIAISNCNVSLSDAPSEEERQRARGDGGPGEGGVDTHSPNPFLPSIMAIIEHPVEEGKGKKGKKGKKKDGDKKGKKGKKGKGGEGVVKEYLLTAESQALDLTSPAGKYSLDLSHPASPIIVRHLRDLKAQVEAAVAAGMVSGVSVVMKEMAVNGKPVRPDRLVETAEKGQGTLALTVQSPALLLASEPMPISDAVVGWMLESLGDRSIADLWKLDVVNVACSHFYFTADQALELLELFDADMATSERLRAAEMLYARCVQPLDFWNMALPELPPAQTSALRQRLGEFAALAMHNPSGRFMFNLSRAIDRLVAVRLQEASALEASWVTNKYLLNWRNAQLNGLPLSKEGLTKLREFTIPESGTLKLDYVTYKVPPAGSLPCEDVELRGLMAALRAADYGYETAVLQVRSEYLAFGKRKSEQAPKATSPLRSYGLMRKPVQPEKRLWALKKLFTRTLADMAREMATAPPPEPEPEPAAESDYSYGTPQPSPAARRPLSPTRLAVAVPGSSGSPPGAGATGGADAAAGGALPAAAAASPLPLWWEHTGLNGRPLLKRLQEIEAMLAERALAGGGDAAAGAAAGGEPGTVSPGKSPSPATTRPPSPEKPRPGSPTKSKSGKGGKGEGKKGKGDKGGKGGGKGSGGGGAKLPPGQRSPGTFMTEAEALKAEELTARVLQVPRLADVAILLSRYSMKHIARVLATFLNMDGGKPLGPGSKVAALLLECMCPVASVRFLYDMFDSPLPLLPLAQRKQLLGTMRLEVLKQMDAVQREVNSAALKRARQVRAELQVFAATHYVSSAQLVRVLASLRHEQDRVCAAVVLWSRVVDRQPGIYEAFQHLTGDEQRQLMSRLGPWHVWSALGRPHGLHFHLELTDPEQKDIARDIVKLASRETMAAKAESKKRGVTAAVQQLHDLHGNGCPITIPEDEKTWSMLESSYQTLEFDYSKSPEQVAAALERCVVSIQRHWRDVAGARDRRAADDRAEREAAEREEKLRAQAERDLREQMEMLGLSRGPDGSLLTSPAPLGRMASMRRVG